MPTFSVLADLQGRLQKLERHHQGWSGSTEASGIEIQNKLRLHVLSCNALLECP